jgi:UDP-N-acetylmuramoylalanine--D-glutamate ligase
LASFKVDHHRLELVGQSNKISWINDSKATNPHAAIASILSHEKVIWIAGGLAKGASMENLVKRAAPRLKAVILIGTDAPLIESALRIHAPAVPRYLVEESDSDGLMKSIVAKAAEVAEPGDVVLLAPACASMDQFSSYAHRGNLFSDCVRNHLQSESH